MPLRDHFGPPLDNLTSWDGVHGQWPAMMVMALSGRLPKRYVAVPHVHLGTSIEVEAAAFERDDPGTEPFDVAREADGGGVATAAWAPPGPTLAVAADVPEADEYEVRVYDARRGRRMVAAVELVSPSNKDRPEHRRAFATKCAAMLQQGVCVAIVDLVTTRSHNLYRELLDRIGHADPSLGDEPTPIYAVSCRWARRGGVQVFESWAHPLEPGRPPPTLPLWLSADLAVPLELEGSY